MNPPNQLQNENIASISESTCELLPVSLNCPPICVCTYICMYYNIHTYIFVCICLWLDI